MISKLYSYVDKVKNEEILTCKEVKQAIKRFELDVKRNDLEFREKEVIKVISFIQMLQHFEGKHNNKHFILEEWQVFIIANIFGFYWKGTNERKYKSAYIEVARKNGKTALMAAISLYSAIEENGAQVLFAANSKEQAKLCFKLSTGFARKFDNKEKYYRIYRNDIQIPSKESYIKVLAAEPKVLDGYSPYTYILDEYHSAPTSEVRDVLKSGQGNRLNYLGITITTAGFDKSLPCYELRSASKEILAGSIISDSHFVMIFTLDENDDWKDSKNWIKANPNLDITVTSNYLKEQIESVSANPSDEVGVKTKNFNIWCESSKGWLSDNDIDKVSKKIEIPTDREVYVGVDLSAVSDLTAVAYMWLDDNETINTKVDYYLPKDMTVSHIHKLKLIEWSRKGYLKLTDGNVVDYDAIINDLTKYQIAEIAYDKFNAVSWALKCEELGMNLTSFPQTLGNFNKGTKQLEMLIRSNRIIIDNNPINNFCFKNTALKIDHCENVKPIKSNRSGKIDGVIAIIQALSIMSENNSYTPSIFLI